MEQTTAVSMMEEKDEEHQKRLLAYSHTDSDTAASDLLGISRTTFVGWRNKHNLPTKGVGGRKLAKSKLSLEELRKLLPGSR